MKFKIFITLFLTTVLISCRKNNSSTNNTGFKSATQAELVGVDNTPTFLMGTLPQKYSLNMPTPGNQGQQGSCTSWSVGYGMASFYMQDATPYTDNSELGSPKFLFNQIKQGNCPGGTSYPENLNLLKNVGICSLSDMSYNDNECSLQPNTNQLSSATKNKILRWEIVNKSNITNIKSLLYSGYPVMISFDVDDNFNNFNTPIIWSSVSGNTNYGSHATVVCGYDDSKNAFKVLNSWGTSFKDNGFFWIDYNFFKTVVLEAYVAYPIKKTSTNDITNGLVLNLTLDGNANDQSGNNNNGIVSGATLTNDRKGQSNKAYQFGGFYNPNFIQVPNSNSLMITSSFSICLWVKLNSKDAMNNLGDFSSNQSYQCLFSKDFDVDCIQSGIFYNYLGNNEFQTGVSGNWSKNEFYNTNISYSLGNWVHLTYVHTGTSLKLYKNGVLVIDMPGNLSYNISNTKDLYIGRFSSKWYPLNGAIDEFRMYNRALTDSEVQQIYQQ